MEITKLDAIEIKAKLDSLSGKMDMLLKALNLVSNLPYVTEASLRKTNPILTKRFFERVKKILKIGKKVGRDIVYTEKEVESIYKYIEQLNQLKIRKTKQA